MEGSGGVAVRDRAALVDGLGLGETASAKTPLLAEILRLSKVKMTLRLNAFSNLPVMCLSGVRAQIGDPDAHREDGGPRGVHAELAGVEPDARREARRA